MKLMLIFVSKVFMTDTESRIRLVMQHWKVRRMALDECSKLEISGRICSVSGTPTM